MADQDELFYLSPDFNPGSLTVANIRNILVKHEIDYPASAKKGDLVAIFDRELKPQAKKLMRRADDVRRRSSGIEDVNGVDHDAPTTSRGNHRQTESISSETQGRALRRSTRQTSVDGENEGLTVPPRSPVKRTSTRSSRASTAEPASETDSVARKKRTHVRGTILPTVQDVQDEDSDVEIVGEGKAFTQDNPFQRSINKPEELEDHRRSTTVRRRVEHTPLAKAAVIHEDPTPKQRQSMPSSKAQKMYASMTPRPERSSLPTPEPEVDDSDEVLDEEYIQDPINAGRADYLLDADPRLQAGEEFSPDEQLELDQMLQSDIDQQALVPRASKRSKATAGALKSLAYASLSILVALTSVFGVFWRQEKIAVGYCDIGREPFLSSWERESLHAQQLRENGITVPSWAYGTIQPLCQSCPVHAVCYDNLITRCDDGFLPTQHPLNPFGLLPLAPTCQPDGIKAHRVAQMTARAIRELRKIRAAAECRLKGADGQPTKTAEIEVQSLQAKVYNEMFKASKKPRMSDEQFEDLWKIVLEDVKARDEVSFTPSP